MTLFLHLLTVGTVGLNVLKRDFWLYFTIFCPLRDNIINFFDGKDEMIY